MLWLLCREVAAVEKLLFVAVLPREGATQDHVAVSWRGVRVFGVAASISLE